MQAYSTLEPGYLSLGIRVSNNRSPRLQACLLRVKHCYVSGSRQSQCQGIGLQSNAMLSRNANAFLHKRLTSLFSPETPSHLYLELQCLPRCTICGQFCSNCDTDSTQLCNQYSLSWKTLVVYCEVFQRDVCCGLWIQRQF